MWLYDSFLLRFDGSPGRSGLGVHVDDDGLGLSINLLLSDPADFAGGGTYFEHLNRSLDMPQGHVTFRPGSVRHGGHPVNYLKSHIMPGPSIILTGITKTHQQTRNIRHD